MKKIRKAKEQADIVACSFERLIIRETNVSEPAMREYIRMGDIIKMAHTHKQGKLTDKTRRSFRQFAKTVLLGENFSKPKRE
jgi:hypothetical protein